MINLVTVSDAYTLQISSPVALLTQDEDIVVLREGEDLYPMQIQADTPILNLETAFISRRTGEDPWTGAYTIIPTTADQVLPTTGKTMQRDMTVTAVPYYQTHNTSGETVYIASEV